MAGIDWSLAQFNPGADLKRGGDYVTGIMDQAAKLDAGKKYAAGDLSGASQTLAQRGDIQGAQQLDKQQQTQAAAAYSYYAKAIPVFRKIVEQHAGDPDGGRGAVVSAFDQIAPEMSAVTGHNDQVIDRMRQSLATDPGGTLDRAEAQLPVEYKTVGRALIRQQGDTTTPIYEGKKDAPNGYEYGPDGKALQPMTGGPADPKVVHALGQDKRDIIVNNPIPGQNGGGESVALSPEGLTNQVDTYIASRGSIIPSFGYGKAGLANRDKFYNQLAVSMKEQNLTANDIASGKAEYKANASALGQVSKMRNQVESYEQTVQKNMDLLTGLVAKGAKTGAPIINRWIQAGRNAISGDPDVTAYNTAIQTVVNEYAKVMAGGTGSSAASSDSARAEAGKLLSNAQTPQQVQSAIQIMRKEMGNRIESLKAQEGDLKNRLGNRPDAPASNLKAKYGLE